MSEDIANVLSEKVEYLIVQNMLVDSSYALKCFSLINDKKLFEHSAANKIYTFVKGYFEKYRKIPDQKAIEFVTDRHDDVREFLAEMKSVDHAVSQDKDFINDITVNYVKRALFKIAIVKAVEKIDKPDQYDAIVNDVKKAMEVSFDAYLGMSYRDTLDQRIAFSRNYVVDGVKSGLSQLDESLKIGNGFLPKNIYIISSESNLGKSIALCNIGANAALQGKNVLFVSLEMQEFFIGQRLDAIMTFMNINEIYDIQNEQQLKSKFDMLKTQMCEANVVIKEYPPGSINIHTLRALIQDLKLFSNFIPDVIIVDYLNLMQPSKKGDNRYHDLKHVTEELRALSYEANAPVITASQLNREGYNHTSPELSVMGESMALVHTADFIAMLSQNEAERAAGQLIWHIKKNRLGPKDVSFPTLINYTNLRIDDSPVPRVGGKINHMYSTDEEDDD